MAVVFVLCWVVVDIFVLLDFLAMLVLLRLHFNMSGYKVLPVFSVELFLRNLRLRLFLFGWHGTGFGLQ